VKKLISVVVLLSFVTLLVVACGGSGNGSGGGNSTDVHMGLVNFVQPTVTISKGSSLNLVNDTATVHLIQNGMWKGSIPEAVQEAGAPTVNHMFNGNDSFTVGPFNSAGTFHLYCTIHDGMNLTVTVQ
jgi:plastocyanin